MSDQTEALLGGLRGSNRVEDSNEADNGSVGVGSTITDNNNILINGQHQQQQKHRRLEDANVDYWRQRAGWADDDEAMKSYNQGVYNTYYMGNDDESGGSGSSKGSNSAGKKALDNLGWILGLASTIIFLIMLVKCCSSAPTSSGRKGRTSSVKSRDSSRSIRDKHGERRSRSRSRAASGRSRSKSRTRSKSKSRGNRNAEGGSSGGGTSVADYKLMKEDDDDDNKSRRSTRSASSRRSSRSRSRSKTARSRSKSKSGGRSSSKSRTRGSTGGDGEKEKKDSSKEQKMLV